MVLKLELKTSGWLAAPCAASPLLLLLLLSSGLFSIKVPHVVCPCPFLPSWSKEPAAPTGKIEPLLNNVTKNKSLPALGLGWLEFIFI